MKRLPVAGPWVTDKEAEYVAEAARTGWYEGAGRFERRFEEAFAAYLGVRHAVSLPHATAGLHLALAALEVGPGDEVVVPEITWIATSAPISYLGATPVFADVDPETWCLDAASFERCITPRTKAVIPVDVYGGMPDYGALRMVADRHGVAVVEDAAEAVGSEQDGRKAGSFGVASVFSFHGSKTLATGEGGLLATNSDQLHARIQVLRDHGRAPGDRHFFNREVAYKYKMSGVQAALGLAQLERIEELVARKREIFGWYREELAGTEGVRLNAEPAGTLNSVWMSTLVLDPALGLRKEELMAELDARSIDSRPFFHPLSSIPAYSEHPGPGGPEANPVAYALSPWGLNLPSAMRLARADVARVGAALREILTARAAASS
ncbi:MAG TPA: DegT/DnrJ/EryC1/StrS family aminotransferase [Planctomycetota bacterium]